MRDAFESLLVVIHMHRPCMQTCRYGFTHYSMHSIWQNAHAYAHEDADKCTFGSTGLHSCWWCRMPLDYQLNLPHKAFTLGKYLWSLGYILVRQMVILKVRGKQTMGTWDRLLCETGVPVDQPEGDSNPGGEPIACSALSHSVLGLSGTGTRHIRDAVYI